MGKKDANAWGLRDMAGNVWEYCNDRSGIYGVDEVDPTGPTSGSQRIRRGGSFYDQPGKLRAAARDSRTPDNPLDRIGFRCVRTLKP